MLSVDTQVVTVADKPAGFEAHCDYDGRGVEAAVDRPIRESADATTAPRLSASAGASSLPASRNVFADASHLMIAVDNLICATTRAARAPGTAVTGALKPAIASELSVTHSDKS